MHPILSDISLITIGCNVLGGHYRNIVAGLMGGGKETKQGHVSTYDACRSAFILLCRLPACHDPDCKTCNVIKATVNHSEAAVRFLDVAAVRFLDGCRQISLLGCRQISGCVCP
jgi:hypothetical protein